MPSLLCLLLLLLGVDHVLHHLHLLHQEGSHDPLLHASSAKHSTVRPRHCFLSSGQGVVLGGFKLGYTVDSLSTVAAIVGSIDSLGLFADVVNYNFGTGCPNLSDLVAGGVVTQSSSVGDSLDHRKFMVKIIFIKITFNFSPNPIAYLVCPYLVGCV